MNLILGIVGIAMSGKDFVDNNKSLFLNLGVPYLLTKGVFEFIKTLFGPVLMIIICVIAICFEKNCEFKEEDLIKKKR